MSDIKLFRTDPDGVHELDGSSVELEKSLQELMERHLDAFLGVRFLGSEYSTGKTHGGRIDTLGIDENGCPVIIEYKRTMNENVINQGLFYLDWLLDHQAEFELKVIKQFGQELADGIDWSAPRLLCIATDFTKYDEHAIQQINRNIELIRYRRYGDELLLLDLVNAVTAGSIEKPIDGNGGKPKKEYTTQAEHLERASAELKGLYQDVSDYLLSLGDDTQERFLRWYIAFKRIRNFATVQLQTQKNGLLIWVKLDPDSVELEEGFIRDVRGVGHHGTGDLEITIASIGDLERAKPLILKSYEAS